MSKTKILEINQAKVALYPIKEVRSIVVDIMIKSGSWNEPETDWGAFHLLEHMLFQGSKNLESHEKIEIFKQENGISNNGRTGGRSTSYTFKFPTISVNQGFDFIENFIFNPLFSQNDLNREILVIEQEYKDKWDNPLARFDKKIYKNLFGEKHIFQRDGLGQPEYIKTLNRSNLQEIHKKNYQPQNMIISVVGNFEVKNVKQKLNTILKKQANSIINNFDPPKIHPKNKMVNYRDQVSQSYLVIDWFLSKNKNFDIKTRYGLSIVNYILGSGASSLLFKKIRQELGLVYNIKSQNFYYPKAHLFEIWASVDTKNLNLLIENIKNILNDFLDKPIDNKIFTRARHFMDLQTLMSFDSIHSISNSLIEDIFTYNKIYSPEESIQIAKSIDAEEIRLLLKKLLDWENAYISIMTPTQNKPE